jgi:Protein of unknown function (DUF1214)
MIMRTFFLSAILLANIAFSQTKYNNEYMDALRKIQHTYGKLLKVADSMSAGLSEQEKREAAEFARSAYSLVMESYVDKGNPAKPAFTVWMDPPRKFGGDNPHTIYSQTPVDPAYEYRISGKTGNTIYLGFQVYGYQEGFNLPTANIGLQEITLNADGTAEVYVSKTRPAGAKNWIPLTEGDHALLVRQYFRDRNNIQPANITIQRVDSKPSGKDNYLQRLENADKMLTEYILGTIDICMLLKENALNAYAKPEAQVRAPKYGGSLYPTRDNSYEGFWVSLKPGEAIHLHGRLPKNALYSSYVFYNRWYITPDYRTVNSFLTGDEIKLNADGTYDLYISPEKINHPNWIDTNGKYEGSYASRYLVSSDKDFPAVKLIKISSLKQ